MAPNTTKSTTSARCANTGLLLSTLTKFSVSALQTPIATRSHGISNFGRRSTSSAPSRKYDSDQTASAPAIG